MTAPTPDEVARARAQFCEWRTEYFVCLKPSGHLKRERERGETSFGCEFIDPKTEIARLRLALDAAERERKDNVGALEDAGVERNEADEIASGIESLAEDRDEWSAEFGKVAALVIHDLEPGDEWVSDEVVEAVKELSTRAEAAERERDEARAALAEVEAAAACTKRLEESNG